MFYNNENNSYNNHWYKWAADGTEKEQLFYDIRQLVEDMIRELVPPMIEEYIKGTEEIINFNVETLLNGKVIDMKNINRDLEEYIYQAYRLQIM